MLPPSLPALARALIDPAAFPPDAAAGALFGLRRVVQAWRVAPPGAPASFEEEAHAAAFVVRHALDRLQRLPAAYGEWSTFEAAAYFDLTPLQAALLVEVREGATAVQVLFFTDLLLPRVQRALGAWADLAAAGQTDARLSAQAQMATAWREATAAVWGTRRLLAAEIGYLAANAAQAERRRRLTDPLTGELLRLPGRLAGAEEGPPPTLTLAIDFPLPAWRQPGRRRRLIRARAIRLARLARSQAAGKRER